MSIVTAVCALVIVGYNALYLLGGTGIFLSQKHPTVTLKVTGWLVVPLAAVAAVGTVGLVLELLEQVR